MLIIDDNPTNLKLAAFVLAKSGYEIRTAADADAALSELERWSPRLILMDLQLPGMDGFELTRRLKADPARRGIKVIAVTAYAMQRDEARALAAGCDGYVAKPVAPDTLRALVAKQLSAVSEAPS
ncbi:MAG: response regulator [Myxococcales bacterium]|nr:response regulator [Myxococcales bacterium]